MSTLDLLDGAFSGDKPLRMRDLKPLPPLKVLVLAPHPDDFDAIGVTMRWLQLGAHQIHLSVLTTGASGVQDGWEDAVSPQAKAAVREREQRASCDFFGLRADRLAFLRLWDDPARADSDHERLRVHLLARQPDLVFMPHGNDSNATHRRSYETFRAIAEREGLGLWALLNQDVKTKAMRHDLFTDFGEENAVWKSKLLRHHQSQQMRNLITRGSGFDARVLKLNREAASAAQRPAPYAEAFELERFG
jgi:LmbE family N-acetylglucosaminyl deacetylase